MQIRRPGMKGYEEVEGTNISSPSTQIINGHTDPMGHNQLAPEFELASVSVVPDGWSLNTQEAC